MSAWTVIAHTEVGSGGASSITFMSVGDIPSTYTDLLIKVSARTNVNGNVDAITIKPNNATANRSMRILEGDGSGRTSFSASDIFVDGATGNTSTSNTFGNVMIYIPNYRSSVAKSFSIDGVNEGNITTAYQGIVAGLWNDTAAITSIVLAPLTGTLFSQYSSATLYGITKGSSGGVVVS